MHRKSQGWHIVTLNGRPVRLSDPVSRVTRHIGLKQLEKALTKETTFHVSKVYRAKDVLKGVLEQAGPVVAKQTRLLCALKGGGFHEMNVKSVTIADALKACGVDMVVDGRNVSIKDAKGEFSFRDDFYWTGCRALLNDLLEVSGLSFPFVDLRNVNSVKAMAGDQDPHEYLKGLLESGNYGTGATRFYGADFKEFRSLEIRETRPLKKGDIKVSRGGRVGVVIRPASLLLMNHEQFLASVNKMQQTDFKTAVGWCEKKDRAKARACVKTICGTLGALTPEALVLLEEASVTRKQLINLIACDHKLFSKFFEKRLAALKKGLE